MEIINDLIYAYSLGCLDPEDNQKFINMNDNELDFKILGEYQNLVSLIPIILTIETPDPILKDNVAKKLYSLKDHKKTIIPSTEDSIQENDSTETVISGNEKFIEDDNSPDEPQPDEPPSEDKNVSREIQNTAVYDNSDISSLEKEIEFNGDHILQNNNSNLTGYRRFPSRHPDLSNKDRKKLIWGIILFGLLSVGLFIAYIIVSSRTNALNKEVEQLKSEVIQLNVQIKSRQEMQNIVQSPNVFAINLTGTVLNKSGFGKLFIDSVKGMGYIQLEQMSNVLENEACQLWAKFTGKIISLGTFRVPDNGGYYSFNIQNLTYEESIDFFITGEPTNGSTSPGNKVYLQGSYNP